MNNSITIYNRKQPVIIHTSNEGEIWVTETETHSNKDIIKTFAKILNKPVKTIKVSITNMKGNVIYNDGCRYLDFTLGYMQI